MAERIKADEVQVIEGNLYEVWGEAEKILTFNCLVAAKVGEVYLYHRAQFPGHVYDEEGFAHVSYSHLNAQRLVDRIQAAGNVIDPEYWA